MQRYRLKKQAPFQLKLAIDKLDKISNQTESNDRIYNKTILLIDKIKQNPVHFLNEFRKHEANSKICKNILHFINLNDRTYGFRIAVNLLNYYETTVPKFLQDSNLISQIA